MTNFTEHKEDNDFWYAPPFYTHPQGYRMRLAVVANGYGDGKGTHTSVYVCMMQGKFDDQLKWPFQGDVNIQIRNQKGKGHFAITIQLDATVSEKFVCKVERGEQGPPWGLPKAISQAEVQSKCLRRDCLHLHLKKVVDFSSV